MIIESLEKIRLAAKQEKEQQNHQAQQQQTITFDICTDNNITSIKQALQCIEVWNIDNGISLC
jgi:hypothetical protein